MQWYPLIKIFSYYSIFLWLIEGFDEKNIAIINSDDILDCLEEIDNSKSKNIYLITWLKSYYDVRDYLDNRKRGV